MYIFIHEMPHLPVIMGGVFMTIFQDVKELVDVPTAARHYGIEVHRGNKAICPFHHERTPSMKLYADHYHCFGCQAHGDVITLVQDLFGLSALDAVKQLNADFSLSLDVNKPPEREEIQRIQRKKQEQEAYANWEKNAFTVLNTYARTMREWSRQYAPSRPEEAQDARFVYALHHAGYAEYLVNEFLLADKNTKISMKGEVEKIERELEKCRKLPALDAGCKNGG